MQNVVTNRKITVPTIFRHRPDLDTKQYVSKGLQLVACKQLPEFPSSMEDGDVYASCVGVSVTHVGANAD